MNGIIGITELCKQAGMKPCNKNRRDGQPNFGGKATKLAKFLKENAVAVTYCKSGKTIRGFEDCDKTRCLAKEYVERQGSRRKNVKNQDEKYYSWESVAIAFLQLMNLILKQLDVNFEPDMNKILKITDIPKGCKIIVPKIEN